MNLCSSRLNIKPAAWAVLHLLSGYELKVRRQHHAETWAWYNGRERSIALTIEARTPTHDRNGRLVIVFGECRNSDRIFVDTWSDRCSLDPPRLEDFTDAAYEKRQMFATAEAAAQHVRKLVLKYCKE